MNLASTKSVASSFFSPAADGTPDAGSSSKTSASSSNTDSDDLPDFLALLTLLFPGNLLAPPPPTVAAESTGGSGAVLPSDGTTPANGLPTANALDAGNNNLMAIAGAQSPLQGSSAPALPLLTKGGKGGGETPFAEMASKAYDVASTPAGAEAPNKAEGVAQAPVAPLTDLKSVTQNAIPTAPSAVPLHAAATEGQGNAAQAKALSDAQANATKNAPTALLEKSPIHESLLTPQLDAMKSVQALTTLDVGFVNGKKERVSDLRDEESPESRVRSRESMLSSLVSPLSSQTETSAKPAISFVDQVHSVFQDNLDHLREQGRVELHMDLHPPELGKMRLHFSMEDNQVNVRMDVQDERAKQLLEQQLQPLRVHFAEMGVTLGHLDVRRDGSGNAPQQGQNADAEARAQLLQQTRQETARLRSTYERELNPDSLVDVLA